MKLKGGGLDRVVSPINAYSNGPLKRNLGKKSKLDSKFKQCIKACLIVGSINSHQRFSAEFLYDYWNLP